MHNLFHAFTIKLYKRGVRRNKSIKRTTRSRKKEQLNEIEKLKNELEKEKKVSLHVYLENKNIALAN